MADLLYIHSDAGEGSTEFVDLSGNDIALTANGDVKHSTTQAKFGATSIYFDGVDDYISMASGPSLGAGDFTIDFWMYQTSRPTWGVILDSRTSASSNPAILWHTSNQTIAFFAGAVVVESAVALNTWTHLAFVRSGSAITLYKDGVSVSTATNSTNFTAAFSKIGTSWDNYEYFGYIDELRIRDEAVWTTNFTPPTSAYVVKSTYADQIMANSPCNYWTLSDASGNAVDTRGEHDLTWS